jgi:uncharacterized protein (DUF362 family)
MIHMKPTRRQFLHTTLPATAALQRSSAKDTGSRLGLPGPYPGRVIEVHHPASIVSGAYQARPVEDMMRKGMMELTGAPGWVDAWRVFFEPGDVVAIKVCPVGGRRCSSDALVLHQIVEGLKQAGVKTSDIVVYNRYRKEMFATGVPSWLPDGVRMSWASEAYNRIQHDMEGYDRDTFADLPLAMPGQDIREEHIRRSYVSKLLVKQVNKVVNLPVLKHHDCAGVTIALKNLSHGFVNNVERSHARPPYLNACGTFIPAIVNTPVFREKVVLNIVDGVRGLWNGGPGADPRFVWEHKTMYFGTDPVALDKVGWKVIDEKRVEQGLLPVKEAPADRHNRFAYPQVEHIDLAGVLGLGVFDDARIKVRRVDLQG